MERDQSKDYKMSLGGVYTGLEKKIIKKNTWRNMSKTEGQRFFRTKRVSWMHRTVNEKRAISRYIFDSEYQRNEETSRDFYPQIDINHTFGHNNDIFREEDLRKFTSHTSFLLKYLKVYSRRAKE